MLALTSVWLALGSLLVALTMAAYRPAMTDVTVVLVLYLGAPGSLCLAGLTLWAHRADTNADPGVVARRVQAKAAIAMSIVAAGIVYLLIVFSQKINGV
jgi:hypothetical protein